jgi:hypothetical protein
MTPSPCLSQAERVRDLNDAFRAGDIPAGQWMITRGVAGLGCEFVAAATQAVRSFDRFTEDNDPHGEHDFGALDVAGERVLWKIDYYDPSLSFGSDDPADPAITRRVLTVMLAEEY